MNSLGSGTPVCETGTNSCSMLIGLGERRKTPQMSGAYSSQATSFIAIRRHIEVNISVLCRLHAFAWSLYDTRIHR